MRDDLVLINDADFAFQGAMVLRWIQLRQFDHIRADLEGFQPALRRLKSAGLIEDKLGKRIRWKLTHAGQKLLDDFDAGLYDEESQADDSTIDSTID